MFAVNRNLKCRPGLFSRFIATVLFVTVIFGCGETREHRDIAHDKLYEIVENLEPVVDVLDNAIIAGCAPQRFEQAATLLRDFITDPLLFSETESVVNEVAAEGEMSDMEAASEGQPDILTASLGNFVDYVVSEVARCAAEGADLNVQFPQIEYEAFLGEIPLGLRYVTSLDKKPILFTEVTGMDPSLK